MFIELHMIQNFAPANLNRDDTGNSALSRRCADVFPTRVGIYTFGTSSSVTPIS
ncbi:MAG: type I-E CRISPR-associated protein Cas7/Cse4/CasC [Anaerolineaceae bacterium]|nr:type I-E CRISPR-associated protein Cas7/Cse4/CasC [Anaerolineaceae bacterium]